MWLHCLGAGKDQVDLQHAQLGTEQRREQQTKPGKTRVSGRNTQQGRPLRGILRHQVAGTGLTKCHPATSLPCPWIFPRRLNKYQN